ncbi:MAG: LysR family transcriptional regulator [Symploca sp. SIO2E9]|nr:LysR family transcriptional regulator [Symploca sp. SIO2E9]
MNLNQLKYFIAVAETGSFTKASVCLFISQPSLSVGIQKLEEELGVRLFERTKKQIYLTSAGKYFQNKAREILNNFEVAKNELRYKNCHQKILKIGCLHTLSIASMTRLISNFVKVYSDIVIEQLSGNVVELEKLLDRGDIDLAISVLGDGTYLNDSQILFQQDYAVAVAKNHPLAEKQSLCFSELDELPYIERLRCEVKDHLQELFTARGIYPRICYRTTQDELCKALVSTGTGVAVMPAQSSIPGVVHLPFSDLNLIRQVGFVCRPKNNSKVVSLFQEFASSYFEQGLSLGAAA